MCPLLVCGKKTAREARDKIKKLAGGVPASFAVKFGSGYMRRIPVSVLPAAESLARHIASFSSPCWGDTNASQASP